MVFGNEKLCKGKDDVSIYHEDAEINTNFYKDNISHLMELTQLSEDDCYVLLNQCSEGSFEKAVDTFMKDGCLSVIISVVAKRLQGATKFIKICHSAKSFSAALGYFKGPDYGEKRPMSVQMGIAIDAGGPKKQFFQDIIDTVIEGTDVKLFEGYAGKLVPVSSSMTLMSNILEIFGRIITHSIVEGGPAFPYLAPPIYWYLITQSVEKAMQYATVLDAVSAGIKYVIDKVDEMVFVNYALLCQNRFLSITLFSFLSSLVLEAYQI